MQEDTRKLTTASGRPYVENDNTMTIGPRGPVLLQDYILHEKMAHFNRERIPERVVHAKGSGAYGTFTVTGDIKRYTDSSPPIARRPGCDTAPRLAWSSSAGARRAGTVQLTRRGRDPSIDIKQQLIRPP